MDVRELTRGIEAGELGAMTSLVTNLGVPDAHALSDRLLLKDAVLPLLAP